MFWRNETVYFNVMERMLNFGIDINHECHLPSYFFTVSCEINTTEWLLKNGMKVHSVDVIRRIQVAWGNSD